MNILKVILCYLLIMLGYLLKSNGISDIGRKLLGKQPEGNSAGRSEKIHGSSKLCGLCDNWGGPRKLAESKDSAIFEDRTDKGECYVKRGSLFAANTCAWDCFVKWKAIR